MAAPFRLHLLVVDDEACIREALTAALGAIYHVHAAASGAAACALLRAHPIAGIIWTRGSGFRKRVFCSVAPQHPNLAFVPS
jgi:CheY-like chemotaxis protein